MNEYSSYYETFKVKVMLPNMDEHNSDDIFVGKIELCTLFLISMINKVIYLMVLIYKKYFLSKP